MDFWSSPKHNGFTDIMITPEQKFLANDYFKNHGLKHSIYVEDVEELIEEERRTNKQSKAGLTWDAYYSAADIFAWLNDVARAYPNLASVQSIGKTYEGKDIQVIKISRGGSGNQAVFIDAGFHAREWIGPAVATYVINELTANADQYDFLDSVDFYIVPVMNVDGYEYSRTSDRMWRKTRSDHQSALRCKGVDPNRNFGYQWGGAGTSTDKCSEIYKGPSAFSEPETQAIRDFILNTNANWIAYITIHSYGQYWLTPWGYTSAFPTDYTELKNLADRAVNALTSHYGTQYTIGTSTNVLYAAAGGSDDWAKGAGGVKYSYTTELRDEGRYGFALPPAQIIPTAIETFSAFKVVFAEFARK